MNVMFLKMCVMNVTAPEAGVTSEIGIAETLAMFIGTEAMVTILGSTGTIVSSPVGCVCMFNGYINLPSFPYFTFDFV